MTSIDDVRATFPWAKKHLPPGGWMNSRGAFPCRPQKNRRPLRSVTDSNDKNNPYIQ